MILKPLNIIFRISLIFLICFVWVRYFINQLWLATLYTALLTISIEFIIHFINIKNKTRQTLKVEDEKLAEQISITFIFSPPSALTYFYNLSRIKHNVKKLTKYIVITDKVSPETICSPALSALPANNSSEDVLEKEVVNNSKINKTILYPYYSFSPITPQNLVNIVKSVEKQEASKLVVCGYKINQETYKLAQNLKENNIILLDSKNCYLKLIKFHNFYPENLKELNLKNKLKFKEILRLSLSKKHAKGYLISSLILLFSSFIVRTNIYYVIMSSFLLLLSLLSFFLPHNPAKFSDSIL